MLLLTITLVIELGWTPILLANYRRVKGLRSSMFPEYH